MMCEINTDYIIKGANANDINSIKKAFPECELEYDESDNRLYLKNPTKGSFEEPYIFSFDISENGKLVLVDQNVTVFYEQEKRELLIEQMILMLSGDRICDAAIDDMGYKEFRYNCCITEWDHYLDAAKELAHSMLGENPRYSECFIEFSGCDDGDCDGLLIGGNNVIGLFRDLYQEIDFSIGLVRSIGTSNLVLACFTPEK